MTCSSPWSWTFTLTQWPPLSPSHTGEHTLIYPWSLLSILWEAQGKRTSHQLQLKHTLPWERGLWTNTRASQAKFFQEDRDPRSTFLFSLLWQILGWREMGWNSSTSIGFVFILAFLLISRALNLWNSSTSIILVSILAFLSILKAAGFWNSNQGQNFPPGPRALPIIGNLLMFDLKRPYRTYLEVLIFSSTGPINQAP